MQRSLWRGTIHDLYRQAMGLLLAGFCRKQTMSEWHSSILIWSLPFNASWDCWLSRGSVQLSYCDWLQTQRQRNQLDGLVQERCNSSAIAMELRLSCTTHWTDEMDNGYYCSSIGNTAYFLQNSHNRPPHSSPTYGVYIISARSALCSSSVISVLYAI